MAFRTSAAYLAALRTQRPLIYCGGQRIADRVSHEGFAPTRHCWGTWIYDCVRDPEIQCALPRIVSIDGEPCHPFWSIPATKEDLLDNIMVARQVSRVSPAAGYATIGRDELAALQERIAVARARLTEWQRARHTRKAQDALEEAARQFEEAFDLASIRYEAR